ncbi:hypothetical protein LRAMOSA04823 [Lichtheimia ramosa]|uniref:Peroxisomal membrane protein PEX16 n=1 Tax=Lichtheimia ramosa TaxID=688394 RepID=A0A077X0S2_9FUNG|nr:hypothetical protein LRAMOSA04823 [Lichtheimia ramosa]
MSASSPLRASTYHRYYDKYYPHHIELLEDLIRGVSLALPGRFEDADLCSQTLISVLNLFLLHHTHLLARRRSEKDESFVFNKHIQAYYRSHWPSKAASLALSIISYTEVVFELLLHRRISSKSRRWRWIVGIEGIKAVLRLVLFFRSGKRTVIHPTHLVRNTDPCTFESNVTDKLELATLDPRTGTPSTANPRLLTASTTVSSTMPRQGWALFGEIVWIIRPVVYAFMVMNTLRRGSHKVVEQSEDEEETEKDDENDWKPWLVSLCIDLLARTARSMQPTSALEQDEYKRRDYLLLYYLLRGPVYNLFTRRILEVFCDASEHRPLVSILATALNDYRPFWEQSYFYTAGS